MSIIPDEFLDLMRQPAFAQLATIRPDGTPQVNPMYFDWDGSRLRFSHKSNRQKFRNIAQNPHIAASIPDLDNPYRYIQIRGRVEHVTEEGASAHIDSLAKKYLGKDKYPWAQPGQVTVTFEIEPTAVQAQG